MPRNSSVLRAIARVTNMFVYRNFYLKYMKKLRKNEEKAKTLTVDFPANTVFFGLNLFLVKNF